MRSKCSLLGSSLVVLALFWSIPALQADGLKDYGAITNSSSEVQRQGSVVWMDLLTSDVNRAVKFYSAVFGWSTETAVGGDYAYATLNGLPVAALAAYEKKDSESEGLWLPSIAVADVDKSVLSVMQSGGGMDMDMGGFDW